VFSRVSSKSVVVEKSKEVVVAYNQMNINALLAVYATDGSHLFISCNRILRQPVSPECSKTTTTTTTTTTPPPPPPVHVMDHEGPLGSKGRRDDDDSASRSESGISGEMIGGIVIGLLAVVALVLAFVLVGRRRQLQKPVDPAAATDHDDKLEKTSTTLVAAAPAEEKEALLAVPEKDGDAADHDGDVDSVDLRPKFASPIWIDEIQKNKIFNRQKSLLSEESIKDLSNGHPLQQVCIF
jgi:hypothetical protein